MAKSIPRAVPGTPLRTSLWPRNGNICVQPACRSVSNRLSHSPIWFQLANVRVTTSTRLIRLRYALPDRLARDDDLRRVLRIGRPRITNWWASSSRSLCYAQGVERVGARGAQRRQRARQQSHDENQQRGSAVNARIAFTDSEELRREQVADGQRGRRAADDTDHAHAQALPEDELHQVARPRADCGSDPEFLPPLGDGVADEPVEPDRRQNESRHGKRTNHAAGQLLRARAGRDDVVGRSDVDDWERRIATATDARIRVIASLMGRDVRR